MYDYDPARMKANSYHVDRDKIQGMRTVFFSDGSDDGFAAAKVVADLLDPKAIDCVAVAAVT